MFVILSVFNVLILSAGLNLGEASPAANWGAITLQMIPIMVLVVVWWSAGFYDELALKIVGWFILFVLVFYSFAFLTIMLGVDRYLGFGEMYLVFSFVALPVPSSVVVWKIRDRYCSLLNRSLTKRERLVTVTLIILFAGYWILVPWDLTSFGIP
jgi:hypothetical protein